LLLLLLLAAIVVALGTGPYAVSPLQILTALSHHGSGTGVNDGAIDTVLFRIRLPRVAAAVLIGAGLSAAGAAYQSLFRNPLASPDLLGVSAGAGLGAVVGILLGLPVVVIQFFGFGGGLLTVAIVILLAAKLGRGDILILVLAGIVIGTLAGAGIALVKVLADPYDQLPAITFWLLGSLAAIKTADVTAVAPAMVVGLALLVLMRWRIGVLSLGDDEARTLGIEVGRLRTLVIVAATLLTASAVAISGVIGWVGLMVPHIARLIVGPRFDRMLPVAVLIGAIFMTLIDTIARTAARVEIPLGILTALVGGPVFVWLLARSRRRSLQS
jgi:iron complex transport system permease protein